MLTIIELYKDYPKHYIKMLLSNKNTTKYSKVVKWIYDKTTFLVDTEDFTYKLQTRLFWILNEKDLTICKCNHPNCKNLIGIKTNFRMNDTFPLYCSTKCSTSDPLTIAKSK